MLCCRSVKGTSTVIFTRLGLNCSTVLGTLLTPVMVRDEGRPKLSVRRPRQSYGDARVEPKPSREPPGVKAEGTSATLVRAPQVPYTRPSDACPSRAHPGRSVVASASALGAEDRRFESCRPDSAAAWLPTVSIQP